MARETIRQMIIVVLNDGTAWSEIDGCKIMEITDKAAKLMNNSGKQPEDLKKRDIIQVIHMDENFKAKNRLIK